MTPATWQQLKAMLGLRSPKRSGAAAECSHEGGPGSKTQADVATKSGESTIDSLVPRTPELHGQQPSEPSHSFTVGEIVAGRFEILRFINSGGMGEVYEGWDSVLRERVALKTIRYEIASSPFVIEHFKREVKQARVISQVNVCRVYEVFSHTQSTGEQIWFLTMELLEGETLSRRLHRQGPIPPDQALELIDQMVAGLAAAHDLGVVHRDFKSSNVMLVKRKTGGTRAVITDFGLARNVSTELGNRPEAPGVGTLQYMAPEQEREGQVGFASDQYALGVVMFEMLTGQRPSRPCAAGRVLWPSAGLDPRWQAAINRCLAYRPEDRFKHVRDVVSALNPERRTKSNWITAAGFVVTAILIGLIFLRVQEGRRRVQGVLQLTPATDLSVGPSLTRNGKFVAYSSDRAEAGNLDIWVQRLPSGVPVRITTNAAVAGRASIAPDGSAVVFRSERNGGGIYLAEVPTGGEHLLVPGGRDPLFSPDGRSIVYWIGDRDDTFPSGRLFLYSLKDGTSTRMVPDFVDARFPVWSSSGAFILFAGCRAADVPLPSCTEWWATSRDQTRVRNTGGLTLLRKLQIQPTEVSGWYGDRVLFTGKRNATTSLWEVPMLEADLQVFGQPQQLTAGDAREVDGSLADDGTIVFEHFTGALHVWWIANASNPGATQAIKVTQDAAVDITPNISPNGHWLAFSRGLGSRRDIWIRDMRSGIESLFLSSTLDKLSPIVDDSGETIAFEERHSEGPSVFASTRGQPVERLCRQCSNPTGWFDGDKGIFYTSGVPSKIKMVDLKTKEERVILEADGTSLSDAAWSPQNQYLLFTASVDGNTKQVFAVLYPKSTQRVTGRWIPITSREDFSERPRWSGDGKTVFYLSTRDGFSCLWGQHFDMASSQTATMPFAVMHYHNARFSPARVVSRSFNLSVSGDSIYLNVGETNSSIWTGVLKRRGLIRFFENDK